MSIFLAVIITAPLAALITSIFELKLNYNLADFLKDKTLNLLKKIPFVGKFIPIALLVLSLLALAVPMSRAQHKPTDQCCGMPLPTPPPK